MARVEALLHRVEALPDPARSVARDLMAALLDVHGAGLRAVLDAAAQPDAGVTLIARIAADPTVSPLLLLHGLHPIALEERVQRGIEEAASQLASHGATIEIRSLASARLELHVTHGQPDDAGVVERLALDAVIGWAPDLDDIRVHLACVPPPSKLVTLRRKELVT